MNAQKMWMHFTALHPEAASAAYEAWAFGSAPDELAALTLAGVKTATCSAQALYELEGEEPPQAGDYSVILDSAEEAICIIRTVRVVTLPYHEVDARHAFKEGEGDRSLAYWRRVHEDFFRRELASYGLTFSEDIALLCEEFEVVYP